MLILKMNAMKKAQEMMWSRCLDRRAQSRWWPGTWCPRPLPRPHDAGRRRPVAWAGWLGCRRTGWCWWRWWWRRGWWVRRASSA